MDDKEEPHAVQAIETRRPVAISDTSVDERADRPHMKEWGVRSVLVVPLVVRNEAIGVIFFNYHETAFAFTEAHMDFAAKLSLGMSLALENARLFADLAAELAEGERRAARIRRLTKLYAVLSRVNEAIVRTRGEGLLLKRVCEIVADEGGFPLVWIGQVKGRQIVPIARHGRAAAYLKEIKVEVDGDMGKGPSGTCIRENRPIVNDDFDTNPRMSPWRMPASRFGFRASAAIPLRRKNAVIGALTLYSALPGAFDAEQMSLLEALAADVSYALGAMQRPGDSPDHDIFKKWLVPYEDASADLKYRFVVPAFTGIAFGSLSVPGHEVVNLLNVALRAKAEGQSLSLAPAILALFVEKDPVDVRNKLWDSIHGKRDDKALWARLCEAVNHSACALPSALRVRTTLPVSTHQSAESICSSYAGLACNSPGEVTGRTSSPKPMNSTLPMPNHI
jgi:GAF domain-containing protein